MNPSILFINGPENEAKKKLCRMLKKELKEYVCVYLNRKSLLSMFNVDSEEMSEESYEWLVQKLLKTFVLNGVSVIFDGFLQTRRIKQYTENLNGLSAYWLGVFFEKKSDVKDFYDFTVTLNEKLIDDENTYSKEAENIFNFISKNQPICAPNHKVVEYVARKRVVESSDRSFVDFSLETNLDDKDIISVENFEFEESEPVNDEFGKESKIKDYDRDLNVLDRKQGSFGRDRSSSRNREGFKGAERDRGSRSDKFGRDGEKRSFGRDRSSGNREGFKGAERDRGSRSDKFERDGEKRSFGRDRSSGNREGFKGAERDRGSRSDKFGRDGEKRSFGRDRSSGNREGFKGAERDRGSRSNRFGRDGEKRSFGRDRSSGNREGFKGAERDRGSRFDKFGKR